VELNVTSSRRRANPFRFDFLGYNFDISNKALVKNNFNDAGNTARSGRKRYWKRFNAREFKKEGIAPFIRAGYAEHP